MKNIRFCIKPKFQFGAIMGDAKQDMLYIYWQGWPAVLSVFPILTIVTVWSLYTAAVAADHHQTCAHLIDLVVSFSSVVWSYIMNCC